MQPCPYRRTRDRIQSNNTAIFIAKIASRPIFQTRSTNSTSIGSRRTCRYILWCTFTYIKRLPSLSQPIRLYQFDFIRSDRIRSVLIIHSGRYITRYNNILRHKLTSNYHDEHVSHAIRVRYVLVCVFFKFYLLVRWRTRDVVTDVQVPPFQTVRYNKSSYFQNTAHWKTINHL